MARPRKIIKTQVIDTEKRWRSACDNCKKPLNGEKKKPAEASARIFAVPRLIFLPGSSIPLLVPELNIHLLLCSKCEETYGEPVAVEDRGFFREQKILWNKLEQTSVKTGITNFFCGYCSNVIEYDQEEKLEEKVGATYVLPRLILKDEKLRQIEKRGSEIKLVICKECVAAYYRPLGVEQIWRFEGDILRPELMSIKKRN